MIDISIQIRPGVLYDEDSLFVSYTSQLTESHLILQDDYNWYLSNRSQLYDTYGNCCLAIKNHTVLGTYSNIAETVRETKKTELPGTFVVVEMNSAWDKFKVNPFENQNITGIKGLYTYEY